MYQKDKVQRLSRLKGVGKLDGLFCPIYHVKWDNLRFYNASEASVHRKIEIAPGTAIQVIIAIRHR